jgi:hypothetical protein
MPEKTCFASQGVLSTAHQKRGSDALLDRKDDPFLSGNTDGS